MRKNDELVHLGVKLLLLVLRWVVHGLVVHG